MGFLDNGFLDNFKIKTKYGALAVTATPVIIIGGIYLALAYSRKVWTRNPDHEVEKPVTTKLDLSRSVSFGVLHGGKLALERMIEYHKARAYEASLCSAEVDLKEQLEKDPPDFKTLQGIIAKLEMRGREAKAVEILEQIWEKQKATKPHEAYEIEMLLVEMLVYKGDFEKAKRRTCLDDERITDARRPLYKAIIRILLGDSKNALQDWDQFNELRIHFQWPPGVHDKDIYDIIDNFKKFEDFVKALKVDIKKPTN